MSALDSPINKRAEELLKALGIQRDRSTIPALQLLIWAIRYGETEDNLPGSGAMMLRHLEDVILPMPNQEAAAYLFGEESDLDPGSKPADVMESLLEMLHLRMTENVEGYPPARR